MVILLLPGNIAFFDLLVMTLMLLSHSFFRYTGEEVVFAVLKGRHHDLVPPNTLVLTYGPGHKHTGAYGAGPDCCWFTSAPCAAARDSWGRVETPEAMNQMKEELAQQFAGWQNIQSLLECEVAVAIRVSNQC